MRGKWKLLIIWLLREDPVRFSQLQRKIPNVKQGPLTAQLKELVASGIVKRKSYNQVPPKVDKLRCFLLHSVAFYSFLNLKKPSTFHRIALLTFKPAQITDYVAAASTVMDTLNFLLYNEVK